MKILQIVGYKKSGKTSLVKKFMEFANQNEITCAAIKHHVHHEEFHLPETDTGQMVATGNPSLVGLSSGKDFHLFFRQTPTLSKLINLYQAIGEADLLLIEGFKSETYPKIVLLKPNDNSKELMELRNTVAYLSHKSVPYLKPDQPFFHFENDQTYIPLILKKLGVI